VRLSLHIRGPLHFVLTPLVRCSSQLSQFLARHGPFAIRSKGETELAASAHSCCRHCVTNVPLVSSTCVYDYCVVGVCAHAPVRATCHVCPFSACSFSLLGVYSSLDCGTVAYCNTSHQSPSRHTVSIIAEICVYNCTPRARHMSPRYKIRLDSLRGTRQGCQVIRNAMPALYV
jgi:hypothetical protein